MALALRVFIRYALARRTSVAWIVAGTAPVSVAVRTPWGNYLFDGTLIASGQLQPDIFAVQDSLASQVVGAMRSYRQVFALRSNPMPL